LNNTIYNLRVGDLVYNVQNGHNVVGLIYKITPKYAYYAICAGTGDARPGINGHWVTMGHKTSKEKIYESISSGRLTISYGGGIKRRRVV